ncbi:MAG: UMP kinase [Henriciella sp.]|nr:UMP kinase [Henriciella sp.]
MDADSETSEGLKYKRVLLKISGEALMGPSDFGIDMPTCLKFAEEIAAAREAGAEICLVIGGGNIFRGMAGAANGMERSQADSMGMLATVMNALAMQSALETIGVQTRVQSGIRMDEICEPFIRRRAIRHMEKGRVVIFAAGTGNPYFTTDTGAALRAAEMHCEAMLKGTQVDGVYSADPKHNPDAVRYDHLTYQDVLARNLRVMDASAVSLMRDTNIPIVVFSLHNKGALQDVLSGKGPSTVISGS